MSLKLCIRPISLSWFAERLGWKETCTFCNLEDLRSLNPLSSSQPLLWRLAHKTFKCLFFFIFFLTPYPKKTWNYLTTWKQSWAMMCKGVFSQANWKLTAMIPAVNLIISILSRKSFYFSTGGTVFSISLILRIEIPVIEMKILILCFS